MPKGVYKRGRKQLASMSQCRFGKPTLKKRKVLGGYSAVHHWLNRNYGKADRCENPKCPKKSSAYYWAKIHGKTYAHERSHFKRLCASCHRRYDFTPEIDRKIKAGARKKAKLNPDKVREIRRLYPTFTQKELAKKYGVSRGAIQSVVERLSWKDI